MEFPHLDDTSYPGMNINAYAYKNNFDYTRWTADTRIKVMQTRLDSNYENVGGWDSEAERDAYFDALEGASLTLTSALHMLPDGTIKLPIPPSVMATYNYLMVTLPVATGAATPVSYEDASNRVTRFFFFVTDVIQRAENATQCILQLDEWTTYAPRARFTHMMLERGHAPLAAIDADTYLANPIARNGYLLTPDVVTGEATQVSSFSDCILNAGENWACFASAADVRGEWGSYEEDTATTPAITGVAAQQGQPSVTVLAVDAGDIDTFLQNVETHMPQFKRTVLAMFLVPKALVTASDSFQFANMECHTLAASQTELDFTKLNKNMFGYPTRYENLAKLYTSPYAHLEITDGNETTVIKIEDTTGTLKLEVTAQIAWPFLGIDSMLKGVGGSNNRTISFRNLTERSLSVGGTWYDTVRTWEIPTFAVVQSAGDENDYATYYDREQAKIAYDNTYDSTTASVETAYENACDSADTAYANAVASAGTTYDNAMASNDTAYANAVASAGTAYDNAIASNDTANTNSLASNDTANTNSLASNDTANTNSLASNDTAYTNATASNATAKTNADESAAVTRNNATSNNALCTSNTAAQTDNMTLVANANNAKLLLDRAADIAYQKAAYDADIDFNVMTNVTNTVAGLAGSAVGAVGSGDVKSGMTSIAGATVNAIGSTYNAGLLLTKNAAMYQASSQVQQDKYDNAYANHNTLVGYAEGYLNTVRDNNNATNTEVSGRNASLTEGNADRTKATADANAGRTKTTADANAGRTKTTADANAGRTKTTADANAGRTKTTADANAGRTQSTTVANAGRTKATADANAGRTKTTTASNAANTQTTAKGNAKRTEDTGSANADRAKDTSQNAVTNRVRQTALNPPTLSGTWNAGMNAATRPMGVFCNVVTQPVGAIRTAGDAFLRYGYALNQAWEASTLNVMENFSYWKASDVWISGYGITANARTALRAILNAGTTVWSNPSLIGEISIYEN